MDNETIDEKLKAEAEAGSAKIDEERAANYKPQPLSPSEKAAIEADRVRRQKAFDEKKHEERVAREEANRDAAIKEVNASAAASLAERRGRQNTLPGPMIPAGMTRIKPNVWASEPVYTGIQAGPIISYSDPTAPNYYKKMFGGAAGAGDGAGDRADRQGAQKSVIAQVDAAAEKRREAIEAARRQARARANIGLGNAFDVALQKYLRGGATEQSGGMSTRTKRVIGKNGTVSLVPDDEIDKNQNYRVGAVENSALIALENQKKDLGLKSTDRIVGVYAMGQLGKDGSYDSRPNFVTEYEDAGGNRRRKVFSFEGAARFFRDAMADAGDADAGEKLYRSSFGNALGWETSEEKLKKDAARATVDKARAEVAAVISEAASRVMPKSSDADIVKILTTVGEDGEMPLGKLMEGVKVEDRADVLEKIVASVRSAASGGKSGSQSLADFANEYVRGQIDTGNAEKLAALKAEEAARREAYASRTRAEIESRAERQKRMASKVKSGFAYLLDSFKKSSTTPTSGVPGQAGEAAPSPAAQTPAPSPEAAGANAPETGGTAENANPAEAAHGTNSPGDKNSPANAVAVKDDGKVKTAPSNTQAARDYLKGKSIGNVLHEIASHIAATRDMRNFRDEEDPANWTDDFYDDVVGTAREVYKDAGEVNFFDENLEKAKFKIGLGRTLKDTGATIGVGAKTVGTGIVNGGKWLWDALTNWDKKVGSEPDYAEVPNYDEALGYTVNGKVNTGERSSSPYLSSRLDNAEKKREEAAKRVRDAIHAAPKAIQELVSSGKLRANELNKWLGSAMKTVRETIEDRKRDEERGDQRDSFTSAM